MAESTSRDYLLFVIPPRLDEELRVPTVTSIKRNYNNLPPFTLMLDWKCPDCGNTRPCRNDRADSAIDERLFSIACEELAKHFQIVYQQFMELRYTDEPRYLIWPSITEAEEERTLIRQDFWKLAGVCEYAAQWQPGIGQQAYLKVVPGPLIPPLNDLHRYEVPIFFIRPSSDISDIIDAKIVFCEREKLPSFAILLSPPKEQTLHAAADGTGRSPDPLEELEEVSLSLLQSGLDGQDRAASVLLTPNAALDNAMQLLICGVPDPTNRALVVHAFRALRHYNVKWVYATLLCPYLLDQRVWDIDIWDIPKYRDYRGLCTAKWWNPEEILDLITPSARGIRPEYWHLKQLNPKDLFKLQFNQYAYLHYRDLDMSKDSTQYRLIEVELLGDRGEPDNFRFVHTDLDREEYAPIYLIHDFVSGSLNARPQCETIWLDGYETAVPVDIMTAFRDLSKKSVESNVGKYYIFLQHLCIDTTRLEELVHHQRLYYRICEKVKGSLHLFQTGSCSLFLELNEHEYKPRRVDKQEIRLLRFKGSLTQDNDSPLEADVIITSIEHAPRFVALSHAWESTDAPRKIMVDGTNCLISNKLDTALRQLRRLSKDSYVWVDFLSIHQKHLDELAAQALLMPAIYKSAEHVFAWLGEEDGDFVRILKALGRIQVPFGETELPERYVGVIRTLLEIDGAVESLMKLLNSSWWRKTWTLQPCVLAKNLKLCIGTTTVEWNTLNKAIQVLHAYVCLTAPTPELRNSTAVQLISPPLARIYEIITLRDLQMRNEAGRPSIAIANHYLLYCLWMLHNRENLDPRDIVYTAFSLARPHGPELRPNYQSTVRQVYHEAAKAIITHHKDLKLLSHMLFSRRRHESSIAGSDVSIESSYYWPSWVPDWRLRPWGLGATTFNLQDWTFSFPGVVLSPQSAYNACGGLRVDASFSYESKVLHVPGIIIGTVKKVYHATRPSSTFDTSGGQHPKADWATLRLTSPDDHNQQQYVSGGTWPAAWIRTCEIMDREAYTGVATSRIIRLREDNFEAALRRLNLQVHGAPEGDTDDIGTYLYGSAEPPSWDGIHTILKPQRLTNAAGETAMETRFHFLSLTSGHVGFGGYAVREGDIVCILKGGSYPYVLRPRNDGFYHFISDAYIHGVMNGELVRNILVQGEDWEEFGIV